MRVGFLSNVVREIRDASRVEWGTASGEPRYRKIKAAPKKMYRADFAAKAGPEILEYAVDGDERPVEACAGLSLLGPRSRVRGKWHRILQFIWATVKRRISVDIGNHSYKSTVKVGDRHLFQRETIGSSAAAAPENRVINKIELNFNAAVTVWN